MEDGGGAAMQQREEGGGGVGRVTESGPALRRRPRPPRSHLCLGQSGEARSRESKSPTIFLSLSFSLRLFLPLFSFSHRVKHLLDS